MSGHVHLLAATSQGGDLSAVMRDMNDVRLNPVKEGQVEEEHEYVYSCAHEPGLLSLKEI